MSKDAYSAVDTFGELGERYEAAFDRVPAQVRSLEWLLKQLPRHAKVVDVGCGTGKPACEMLAEAGHDVTGIDITPKMIEIARRQVPKAKFEVADSRSWTNTAPQCDGIVSYFAFIAAVTQDDIRTFFRQAYASLKPGGNLVFGTVPVEGENVGIRWMGKDIIVSSLSAEETVKAIKAAGFEIEFQETASYMPKAVEAGICAAEDVWEEPQLFVYAQKPLSGP